MGADIYDWDRVHGKGSYAAMADAQDKRGKCSRCGHPETADDPLPPNGVCFDCQDKEAPLLGGAEYVKLSNVNSSRCLRPFKGAAVITLDGLPSRFDDLPEDIREQLAAFAEQGFEDAAAAISLIREASRMQPPSTRLPDE